MKTYNSRPDPIGPNCLKEILNRASSTVELSRFNYDYRPTGEITAWTQQADGTAAQRYDFDYDEASQLTGATLTAVSSGTVLKRHLYQYDKAGNRVSEQIDATIQQATHNNVNQLVTRSAGGPTRVQGSLNEAGTVTVAVNGGASAPATMLTGKDFVAHPTLNAGANTVALTAKDGSNNTATKEWQVTIPSGAIITLSYDDNGNLLDDGAGRTFEWDAANRLLAISTSSTLRTEFTYDPLGRRVKIVEKDNGTTVSTKQHLWAEGFQPVEERDATHAVTKRFYAHGMQAGTDKYFYTRDHLGSIRELTDETKVIRARYDYDPFGRRTKVQGDLEADFGFTGHYAHAASGLSLTVFRAYDANLGRWPSMDPIEEQGGLNLYGYVYNNPVAWVDPLGLETAVYVGFQTTGNPFGHAAIGFTGSGIYSFGTGTPLGSSFTDYVNSQIPRRDSIVYLLKTTPEQEQKMKDYLSGKTDSMPNPRTDPGAAMADNCSRRTEKALNAGGIPIPASITPLDLAYRLTQLVRSGQATVAPIPQNATYVPPFLSTFNPTAAP